MNVLTILTPVQWHVQALEDILSDPHISKEELYTIQCAKNKLDMDAFAELLEHIVILAHPVYGHAPKLADMAFDLRNTEIHQTNTINLARYIKEHDVLHLEGYATFRMANYRHKLDMMMYCLVKKLKLTENLI
ncbi:MAG: hypothetical protein FWD03_06380 [Defluviitaleaceae bacterium]|nr:hypothetical protein [Defluviitaleaceae bacterium]